MKRLGDVEIGDAVLSMDKDGKPVYSTVYYIPHESHRTQEIEYIRVSLESMDHHEVRSYVPPWSDIAWYNEVTAGVPGLKYKRVPNHILPSNLLCLVNHVT